MKTYLVIGAFVLAVSGTVCAEPAVKKEEGRYQVVAVSAPAPATIMVDTATGRVWVLEKSLTTNELEFVERAVVGLSKSFVRQDVEDGLRRDLIKKRSKLAAKLASAITMGIKAGSMEPLKPEDWWKEMVNPAYGLNEFPQLLEELNARLGGMMTTPFDAVKMKDAAEKGQLAVVAGGALKLFNTPDDYEAWKQSGSK